MLVSLALGVVILLIISIIVTIVAISIIITIIILVILIIINIKEVILFIVVVVQIDDAQIITWTLIIFLLSSILIEIAAHFIFFNFIYSNLILSDTSALVKVPFKYQIIALFIVLGIESMS